MAVATAAPSALWYLTRATGSVTLVLLTVSVALGIANIGRLQSTRWPRFVVEGLHRNVSLLALSVLAVHIVTTVLDPFASMHALDALIPFISSYRPLWLGLGAFASDLLVAIALTSMVRRRLGHSVWRATHWFAYLCWPVAVLHAVGTGSDVRQLWMLGLLAGCTIVLILAVWARVGFGWPSRRGLRGSAVAASVALPLALAAWLPSGPLAAGWAARAGSPRTTVASTATTSPAIASFSAHVSGSVTQRQTANGLVEVTVSLTVAHSSLHVLNVRIDGQPVQGGGVAMTGSAVTIGTTASPTLYDGVITALDGRRIAARVASADGHGLSVGLVLSLGGAAGSASGELKVTPV